MVCFCGLQYLLWRLGKAGFCTDSSVLLLFYITCIEHNTVHAVHLACRLFIHWWPKLGYGGWEWVEYMQMKYCSITIVKTLVFLWTVLFWTLLQQLLMFFSDNTVVFTKVFSSVPQNSVVSTTQLRDTTVCSIIFYGILQNDIVSTTRDQGCYNVEQSILQYIIVYHRILQ